LRANPTLPACSLSSSSVSPYSPPRQSTAKRIQNQQHPERQLALLAAATLESRGHLLLQRSRVHRDRWGPVRVLRRKVLVSEPPLPHQLQLLPQQGATPSDFLRYACTHAHMHTCTHTRTHAHTHTHEDGHADPDHARTSQLLIRRNRALCRLICPTPLPSINSCSCQQSLRNYGGEAIIPLHSTSLNFFRACPPTSAFVCRAHQSAAYRRAEKDLRPWSLTGGGLFGRRV